MERLVISAGIGIPTGNASLHARNTRLLLFPRRLFPTTTVSAVLKTSSVSEEDVVRIFLKDREENGDFISKFSDSLWKRGGDELMILDVPENGNAVDNNIQQKVVLEDGSSSGFLKLTKAQEWISGDSIPPVNKKSILQKRQNDSDKRKKLNFLKYEALKRELLVLTGGIGVSCSGYCLLTLSVQASISYAIGVLLRVSPKNGERDRGGNLWGGAAVDCQDRVRAFADNFNAQNLPLNLLINNAGVMFCPFRLSEDEVEMHFATNHLGHFLLTNLLLDKMKMSARDTGIEGRIVNLSSIAHRHPYPEGIRFDGINDESRYSSRLAYGQSKLANILHVKELSRRLKNEGANITVNSLHPGLIMTNLMRHSAFLMSIFRLFTFLFWKNVPQGAATTCYAALHPSLRGVTNKYFIDCNEVETSALARDQALAEKLWDFSEDLVRSSTKPV